jgi:3-methylfumaryl-CoA hydratase
MPAHPTGTVTAKGDTEPELSSADDCRKLSDSATPTLEDCGFSPEANPVLARDQATRLAACIDADPDGLAGGELPMLWHWALFVPNVATAELGEDGHPRRRAEMAEFPRRMWVGGRVEVAKPLVVDEVAHRASRLVSASQKDGSSGRSWLVTVGHTITQRSTVCVEEEQDVLFREPSQLPAPGPERNDAPEAKWTEELRPSSVLLFRFSAVTNNAHRIHYDNRYAVDVEGYPDLVVQAPLTAVLLAELARRHTGQTAHEVSYRARAPLYANGRLWLTGNLTDGGTAKMAAVRSDHVAAMTLEAR